MPFPHHPRRRAAHHVFALVALTTLTACVDSGSGEDAVPLEDADPMALTWVAPSTASVVAAGDVVELMVATHNPEARTVRFLVDGAEVFTCDPAAAEEDCRLDEFYRFTMVFATPGEHTLAATFATAAGERVEAAPRVVYVLAESPSTTFDPEGSADEADPVASEELVDDGSHDVEVGVIVDSIVGPRGYLDPSRPQHNLFGGRSWGVTGQRVVLAHGSLDGSVGRVVGCMERYGASIRRYADVQNVSRASVVATLLAQTDCGTSGNGRGPMGLTAATCAALTSLNRAECRQRMASVSEFAIDVGVRYMAAGYQRRLHRSDPPKLAAAYTTGALRNSRRNPWSMVSPGNYIDRFVAGYNAYRTWERRVVEADEGLSAAPASSDAEWRFGGGAGYPQISPTGAHSTRVATYTELEAALASATTGAVVFVDNAIELTNRSLCIPAGVTLASDRGRDGSRGARLFVNRANATAGTPMAVLRVCGNGVRVTGLRIDGGEPTRCPPGVASPCTELPVATGIAAFGVNGLEVDNCELTGWTGAAVDLTNSANNRVHHNAIHHNQREARGYGVVLGLSTTPTQVLVTWNLFDFNRHAVAGTGAPGQRYEARNNLVGRHSIGHVFDIHGHGEHISIPDDSIVAGTRIKIHHNTVLVPDDYAVRVRGRPEEGAWTYSNCLARPSADRAAEQTRFMGHFWVDRSPSGPAPNQYGRSCGQCETARACASLEALAQ